MRFQRCSIMPTPQPLRAHAGFSLPEITIILTTLSVLGAAVSPTINDYVADARRVTAVSDVRVIASTLARLLYDVGGQVRSGGGAGAPELLVGAGLIPTAGSGGDAAWLRSIDGVHVGAMDDHLLSNAAGYRRGTHQYLVAAGWSGPYVEAGVGPDPWGNRYAVNVGALTLESGAESVVLCAGPNGMIDTGAGGSRPASGIDDIIGLLGSGGR
jgi:type II secretory pathway pseudopilin PulG